MGCKGIKIFFQKQLHMNEDNSTIQINASMNEDVYLHKEYSNFSQFKNAIISMHVIEKRKFKRSIRNQSYSSYICEEVGCDFKVCARINKKKNNCKITSLNTHTCNPSGSKVTAKWIYDNVGTTTKSFKKLTPTELSDWLKWTLSIESKYNKTYRAIIDTKDDHYKKIMKLLV